jgi:hypothetical protein
LGLLAKLALQGRTTKNEEGEAPHLIFYVTPSLRDHSIILKQQKMKRAKPGI